MCRGDDSEKLFEKTDVRVVPFQLNGLHKSAASFCGWVRGCCALWGGRARWDGIQRRVGRRATLSQRTLSCNCAVLFVIFPRRMTRPHYYRHTNVILAVLLVSRVTCVHRKKEFTAKIRHVLVFLPLPYPRGSRPAWKAS